MKKCRNCSHVTEDNGAVACDYCGLDWNSGVFADPKARNESKRYDIFVAILVVLACLMIMAMVLQIMHVGS
jgi:hypothetical protein